MAQTGVKEADDSSASKALKNYSKSKYKGWNLLCEGDRDSSTLVLVR